MESKQIIDTLNSLIEDRKDGEFGFRNTAEYARTERLQQILEARADDCLRAARELQHCVARLGGDTAPGAACRGRMDVMGTLVGYSDLDMLEEAERGEETALARYREALERDLPAHVRVIVQRQYEGARRNHRQIRELRDQQRRLVRS